MSSQNQKKTIEVFRTFFQKIVLPSVKNQPRIMQEWKYLISIMSEEPLDNAKLDLYISMFNYQKSNKVPVQHPTGRRKTIDDGDNSLIRSPKMHVGNNNYNNYVPEENAQRDQKQAREQQKRKMLSALQAFHSALVQNQHKLQNDCKDGRLIKQKQERKYL